MSLRRTLLVCCVLPLLVACVRPAQAENWPRFRGENGTGVSRDKGIPVTWSEGDYAFNVDIPGVGHAAPIVWENRLFVTSALDQGAVRELLCLDAATGRAIWSRSVGFNKSHKHAKNSWASSTPATDGKRVYVAFGDVENHTLSAYDFDGGLVWRRSLGTFESQHGQGVSPIVHDGLVILTNDQDGPSSIVAFDAETGDTRWSILRSIGVVSYATPMVHKRSDGTTQLVCVSGAAGITGHDPATGRMLWETDGFPLRTVASPVLADGLVIASCGQGGAGGVLLRAVDPNGTGKVQATHVKYERKTQLPYVPTPIAWEGHLYFWNDNGVVCCVEAKTGENVWVKRIGGNYSGSPVCIDGKLYGVSEDGKVTVLAASTEFKDFGTTELNDPSHSTPAVANGRLYLRTYHRLMCLPAKKN